MNLRRPVWTHPDEEAFLVGIIQGAGDAQDRMRAQEDGAARNGLHAKGMATHADSPARHSVSATDRGQWDRLRAQGFSGADAAKIIMDAKR